MATIVAEHIGRLFISLQQIRQVPRMLTEATPSMPATLRDSDVPACLRDRHITSGYRQLHQNWRYYFFSLFQRHSETLNVWTHLIGLLIILAKFCDLAENVDFVNDRHAWPLLVLLISSLNYTAFSVIAHLLGSKSELCHFIFYYLDYVGVAQYQYGSALVHFYYAIDANMYSLVKGIYLPTAATFSFLSFVGCCYGKYNSLHSCIRKFGHVVPSALAYLWDISPVIWRLVYWSEASDDPALVYHFGQVACFLTAAAFYTFPIVEKCFPGQCNFLGQSHQIFHIFMSCTTLCQIHASFLDYVGRRDVYLSLHKSGEAGLYAQLYAFTIMTCVLTGGVILRRVNHMLVKHKCI
ncbi:progestin and adipoQ receptor family member VII, a [Boleophthalmus pectinirostris]|uniref:progestin and adipoQ receptor family member VII, a n=1 Tax=Boleophthalmus pectinirostris TaxID=150288 RepID=UPI000A1C7371|nr:progestin and adipoQ receptor family member VII, a [Boleophthalmus pectinirostris]